MLVEADADRGIDRPVRDPEECYRQSTTRCERVKRSDDRRDPHWDNRSGRDGHPRLLMRSSGNMHQQR